MRESHGRSDGRYRADERSRDAESLPVFDISFDYKTDRPAKTRPDADRDSPKLRSLHELLWTKRLKSGILFAPKPPLRRRDGYLPTGQ
ncbi:DUF6994 family protein [Arthrobacter sp. SLBN-100]|uniref:DUF6994 family protein n=1 Tax=Arthrobacter sp. SLBN-100 TaxID=2768450 RepID=UPI003FA40D70